MSAVDWTSMTDAEVFEAVRAAPKISGPWKEHPPDASHSLAHYSREEPKNEMIIAIIVPEKNDQVADVGWNAVIVGEGLETFSTLEEAKTKIDEILRRAGWRLA